jgi:hypothetical protein
MAGRKISSSRLLEIAITELTLSLACFDRFHVIIVLHYESRSAVVHTMENLLNDKRMNMTSTPRFPANYILWIYSLLSRNARFANPPEHTLIKSNISCHHTQNKCKV